MDFSTPVTSATFFYVNNSSFIGGMATAYSANSTTALGSVSSKLATTTGDPANFVTLQFSQPIAKIRFSGGVVDNFSFTTSKTDQAYYVNLQAGQTASNTNFGDQYIPTALKTTSLTPTPSGFVVKFASPINQNVLNLYDSGGLYGSADATLVGAATGPVHGSMVISPDGLTATFIQTGGLLAPDTYTLTLHSGSNAFENTTGGLLDGNGDGVPGDDLVTTFTVNPLASNAVVVSLPDFARGYGQAVNVPANTTGGLPITISTGLNVSSVQFTLTYDPTLLTLSDNSFSTTIAGASAVFHVVTPGTATLNISSATQFSSTAGAITLGSLAATVPNTAPYSSKEILHFANLLVFDNSPGTPQLLPSVGDDAIHVAAFFGDVNGDGKYTTQDVTLEQRVIGLVSSGFAPYRWPTPPCSVISTPTA